MRTGEIARQQAHYRKGVVLGLTVAETLLLLLFALLLALGFVLTQREQEFAALRHAVALASEERQLLQAKVDVLEAIASDAPTDDFYKELVKARQAQAAAAKKEAELTARENQLAKDQTLLAALKGSGEKAAELKRLASLGAKLERELARLQNKPKTDVFDTLPAAVAAMDAAASAGLSPQDAREALKSVETTARENSTLKGQLIRMRDQLAKVGKGGEDPPCWVTEGGKIEYLFDIDLVGSGTLRVRDATPPARLIDRRTLPIPPSLYGRDLTPGEFLRLTLPVFRAGQSRQCRYFVFANDLTGPTQKVTFQNLLLTVEGHFYKNLRRGRAQP